MQTAKYSITKRNDEQGNKYKIINNQCQLTRQKKMNLVKQSIHDKFRQNESDKLHFIFQKGIQAKVQSWEATLMML